MRIEKLKPSHLTRVKGTDAKYKCKVNIDWEMGRQGSDSFICVKKGTQFDVSAPRGLKWAANPHNPDLLFAAAIHDQLLVDGYDGAVASAEFRRALKARGISSGAAWRMFFATLAWTAFLK